MKDAKSWIIAVLLSIIFALIGFSVNREIGRLDRNITVLHERVNGVIKSKADRSDVRHIWKEINRNRERINDRQDERFRDSRLD